MPEGSLVADIVGTAIVTVRAVTTGVKRDIQRGIDKGVKDSAPSTKMAGERIGRQLGSGIQVGLNKSVANIGNQMASGLSKRADRDGQLVGRKIGRSIGKEVAFQIRRIPLAPFLIAGIAPILAGAAKLIASFVGSAISFIQPLGPAFVAVTTSAAAGVTALGQAGLTMMLAWKAEGPALDAFKERMKGVKEEFYDVGRAVQSVLFKPLGDSIDRMVANLLPALQKGLVDTGRVLANISVDFAKLSADPIFQAQFASILASNNVVLANFGRALVSLTSAATTLVDAGGPLLGFFSNYVRMTASGWADTLRMAQETGRLSGFLQRATVTLQQLGRIGENVRIALGNTFRSAATQAEHLWSRFETLTERWRTFTESVRGQRVMDRFFAEASAVTTEVSALFGDMFTMIGRGLISSSDGLISFIRAIRFEVLPSVAEMARSFATLGPVITRTVVSVAQFFTVLSQTGVLSAFLNTLTTALNIFSALLSMPVVGWVTGVALSFAAMGKALNIITLGAFARALTPLGGLFGGLVVKIGAAITGFFGLSAAAGAAKIAISGLNIALGAGVLGLAIGAVSLALGFLVGKHEDAKAAAADQARVEQELAATLDNVTGAVTRATREFIAQELVSSGAAETATGYGIALQTVVDAASGNEEALASMNEQLADVAEQALVGTSAWEVYGPALRDAGISSQDLAEAIVQLKAGNEDVFTDLIRDAPISVNALGLLEEVTAALGPEFEGLAGFVSGTAGSLDAARQAMIDVIEAMSPADRRIMDFNTAMSTLNDTAATTDERLQAVKDALDALEPSATGVEETTGRLNEVLRDSSTQLQDAEGNWLDMTGAIDANTGKINTATEGGYALFQMLEDQNDAALTNALAIRDAAEANGTLATAGASILAPLQQAKDAFVAQAEAAGIAAPAAQALWDTYAQNPEIVSTLIQTEGLEDSKTGVADFSVALAELDATEAIATILGDDADLADDLVKNRGDLTAFDAILAEAGLDADDSAAQAKLAAVLTQLGILDETTSTPAADLDPTALELERRNVVLNLDRLHAMKPTPQTRMEISEWQAKKRIIDSNIAALNAARPTPRVRGEDQEFQGVKSRVQGDMARMNALRANPVITAIANTAGAEAALQYLARARTMTIRASVTGRGVLSGFAEGGIARPGGRTIRAANGLMARQAMIARGGSNILWAEPETENESYIPHSPRKRARATKVLAKTAHTFGYGLYQMAEGGLTDSERLSSGSTGTNTQGLTGDVFNINVDGPEVATRARAMAAAIQTEQRRASALRGRIPR